MSYKDFDAMLREKSGSRPEFTVGGQKFTCRSKLSWRKLASLLTAYQDSGSPTTATGIAMAERFFEIVILKEHRERFMQMLNSEGDDDDDEAVVSLTQFMDLMDWLMEYYTGQSTKDDPEAAAVVEEAVKAQKQAIQKVSLNPVV